MSRSGQLRKTKLKQGHSEAGLKQEKQLVLAVQRVEELLKTNLGIQVVHAKTLMNTEILDTFAGPKAKLACANSGIRPDGGILYYVDDEDKLRCILVSEHKKQGTNDERVEEGKTKQSKGNAIERSSKNVMAVQRLIAKEEIFPYVIFAHGCDFEEGSSIVDRCHTMTYYRPLNVVHNKKFDGYASPSIFVSGSRDNPWSFEQMVDILYDVAKQSIEYYQSK